MGESECYVACEYEVAKERCSDECCGNVPFDDLASNEVDKSEEKRDSAGLTDRTAVSSEKELKKSCALLALIESVKGSSTADENVFTLDSGVSTAANCTKGEEHKYASRDSGVNYVLTDTAEEAFNDYDGEHGTDNALPKRNLCAEVECEKKTGHNCGAIVNCRFFAAGEVEEKLCYNRACNASENDPKSLNTEDHNCRNGCGEHCDDNVKHYFLCCISRVNVGSIRYVECFHYALPPSFLEAAYFLSHHFASWFQARRGRFAGQT